MKYSSSTGCFYPADIQYEQLPPDLIDVSQNEYRTAMNRSHEQILIVVDGRVAVADKAEPDQSDVALRAAELERFWRDSVLRTTDNLVARHRDELDDNLQTTLTDEQFSGLQAYRRELRKWPEAPEFPSMGSRPEAPLWLEQLKQ